MNDLKENKELHGEMQQLTIGGLGKQQAEDERYKSKWNWRLNGLKEDREENTHELVTNITSKIQPSWRQNISSWTLCTVSDPSTTSDHGRSSSSSLQDVTETTSGETPNTTLVAKNSTFGSWKTSPKKTGKD